METSSGISKTAASKMAGFDIGCHRLCHWYPKLHTEVRNTSWKKTACQNLLLLNGTPQRDAHLFAQIFTSQLAPDAMQVGHLALLMPVDLVPLLARSLAVFFGLSQGLQRSKRWREMFCDETADQQSTYMLLTLVS